MSRRVLIRVVLAVAVVILTTSSCSDSTKLVAPEQAIVIAKDATSAPGTSLGAGFVVERGSVLLGAPFPMTRFENGTEIGEGFRALIAVTAEPYRTFRRYIDRAVQLGFAVRASSGGYCELTGPQNGPTEFVHCSATTHIQDPLDGRPGRCFCEPKVDLSLSYGRSEQGIPVSLITLHFSPAHNPERFAREAASAPPGPSGRVPRIRVRSHQHLPRTGELIGHLGYAELRVAAGSRVVAMYGNSALLEVTGGPISVFNRYLKQVGATEPDEHAVLPRGELWAEGGDCDIVRMFRTRERTWLFVGIYDCD